MASGGLQKIKHRIKSIESTKKITNAMELVATSKLKKAKEQLEKAKPFFTVLYDTMTKIATSNREFSSIYTKDNKSESNLYIVIAGDRGLAGGYNSNILKFAQAKIDIDNDRIIAIGKKSKEYFCNRDCQIVFQRVANAENLSLSDMDEIAKLIVSIYKDKKIRQVHIVYTDYLTTLTQEPKSKQILPLNFSENLKEDLDTEITKLIEYDPNQEEVFDKIIPTYITGILYGALIDSYAAENAARRNAMDAATDNATELIDKLDLLYNRVRQSSITQEITEIVNGAGAVD